MKCDIREHGRKIDNMNFTIIPRRGDVITTGYKNNVYLVERVVLWNDDKEETNASLHVHSYKNELDAKNSIDGFY